MKIFGREPAMWLALVAALIQLGSQFVWHLSADQQGVLNACAAAVVGLITAAVVDKDGLAAAITGLVQAMLAVGLAFGWQLDGQGQAVIMAAVSAIVGMFVRTQVTAKVPPRHAGR